MAQETHAELRFDRAEELRAIAGQKGAHLRLIERQLPVQIHLKADSIALSGAAPDVALVSDLLEQLATLSSRGYPLYPTDVDQALQLLRSDGATQLEEIFLDTVFITSGRRTISPRSPGQKLYIDAIRRHDVVFGIGPAGTGKTYLAMAMAVAALSQNQVKRIILARPAVEAGEKLGFLPGSLIEKVNPYLRPLYDALYDMMEAERARELVDQGIIEVAPLAFMRGRTLNDCFVILDEAQNTTREQMKMFLTRLGFNSKAVVTGDVTQVDLPKGAPSGLKHSTQVLHGVDGIGICYLRDVDVVRHPLVKSIVRAYERFHSRGPAPAPNDAGGDSDS